MWYHFGLLSLVGVVMAACGGSHDTASRAPEQTGQQVSGEAPSAKPTVPTWMHVNLSAKTVSMDIQAGQMPTNNHWNFNGYTNGNATITVPAGYQVTIHFSNHDPVAAHSIGIDARTGNFEAALTPQPAFANAVSPDPTSPAGGTSPGKSATVVFTADKPGQYSMVCYMPGHAAAGMWAHFDVSSDGELGVTSGS